MNAAEWIESRSGLVLRPWQHAVTEAMFPADGSPSRYETFLISTVKKAGKTTLNAWCTLYAALNFPAGETAYVVANDQAQAEENIFDLIVAAVREAGLERGGGATIRSDRIIFENGTRIIAIPADFAGVAGGRFGITSWTELWAFRYEAHIRLWEEMTPNPNRRSLRIVDSYAGFTGDSPILEPMWARAVAGDRLHDELPVFTNGKLWAFIDTGEEAQERAWLGTPADREDYYTEQRATLRLGTYNRLHLNMWQQGSEAFVSDEDWTAITARYDVPHRVPDVRAYVGVDIGMKRDSSAVVAVGWDESGLLALLAHRIWIPPKGGTLDLESTVEAFVRELAWRFGACRVTFDPSQMLRSAAELRRHGVAMHELPQTTGNLTQASQALFDIVKERRLRCYEAPDLRQHVLNAVVVESPRGWRLAKEKSAKKIDGAVALSFAVGAAVGGSRARVNAGARVVGGGEMITRGAMSEQW